MPTRYGSGYLIRCLGMPALEHDGAPVRITRRKSLALLCYLAVTGTPQGRETLAAFFWPEYDAAHAAGYLRNVLFEINNACPDHLVDADRTVVRLSDTAPVQVDVAEFVSRCDHGQGSPARLQEALALYRGNFLAGFTLKDAPEFDGWQARTAEGLRQRCQGALRELIRASAGDGDISGAINLARRLLGMDEMVESSHRLLMALYALNGEPAAVAQQYRRCAAVMRTELDTQPDEETTRLYERVRLWKGALPPESDLQSLFREVAVPDRRKMSAPPALRAPRGPTRLRLPPLLVAPFVLAVAVGAAVAASRLMTTRYSASPTLAVLPLAPSTDEPARVSFAGSVTDALITEMGKARTIPVRQYTEVSPYGGRRRDDLRAAKKLGAWYLVTGVLQEEQDGYTISARLIDVRNGGVLLAQDFASDASAITDLLAGLATSVSMAIEPLLPAEVRKEIQDRVMVNPQCPLLYLSQYHQNLDITEEEATSAYATIDAALDTDLSLCTSYLEQADVYWNNAPFGQLPPSAARSLFRKAIDRVEAEEGRSPLVALSRGIDSLVYGGDEAAAGDLLRAAVSVSPGSVAAHRWLAAWMINRGDCLAALRELDEAGRLDPRDLMTGLYRAAALYYAGRYDEVIDECTRWVQGVRENWIPYLLMGCAKIQEGDFRGAEASLLKSQWLKGGNGALAFLGYVQQKTGRPKNAQQDLALLAINARGKPSGVHDAIILVAVGDRAKAATRLLAAAEVRDPLLLWALRDPILQPLVREDPDLATLLTPGSDVVAGRNRGETGGTP